MSERRPQNCWAGLRLGGFLVSIFWAITKALETLLQETNLEDTTYSVQHTGTGRAYLQHLRTHARTSQRSSGSTARTTSGGVCACALRGLWLSRANMASDQIRWSDTKLISRATWGVRATGPPYIENRFRCSWCFRRSQSPTATLYCKPRNVSRSRITPSNWHRHQIFKFANQPTCLALTDWFLQPQWHVFTARYGLNL
jgi:hypothetical protein